MKRFDLRTVALLTFPALILLVFGLFSKLDLFSTRPPFRVLKNELLTKNQLLIGAQGQPGKAIYNVEYEIRQGSFLENIFRHEATIRIQNLDIVCVDSQTGASSFPPTSGYLDLAPNRKRCYGFYRLHDLRKFSGDMNFIFTLSFLEGEKLRKWPVHLVVPRSKLPK